MKFKPLKNIWKFLFPSEITQNHIYASGIVATLLMLSLLFFNVYRVSSQEGPVTVFSQNEWCHVKIAGSPIESVAWVRFGEDVQLSFFAFNDSTLSYDQFVITPNKTFSDPLGKFEVFWSGEITVEEKIVLVFSSIYGQISTVVEAFPGEVPHWGRPSMKYVKSVITTEGKIYDVVIGEEHVASFEWAFVVMATNETGGINQTFPQLIVYDPSGTKFDTRVLTTTFVPLVEYYDLVGWIMESMGTNYVKWILYSGESFQVRLSQGFGARSLPFFVVYPASLTVYPGDTVTIQFTLPSGVSTYSASWNDFSFSKYIQMNSEPTLNQNGQYEVKFKFLESAENKRFTIRVTAEKYGIVYEGTASITVQIALWKVVWVPILVIIIAIIIAIFAIRRIIQSRKEPLPPPQAFRSP